MITFQKHTEYFTFHDPTQGGKLIQRPTEIRRDPLTGETSRIVHDPGAPFVPPDYTEAAGLTSGQKCPFCAENVFTSTPSFPHNFIAEGRLVQGEAVVFPNLFPYSKHSAVVRMSDQHYVRLAQFTLSMLVDTFSAAHHYLDKLLTSDRDATYASINWNYLPASGGSILHPHMQVLASEQPTRYQALADEHSRRFYEQTAHNYYDALIKEEHGLGERWIGRQNSLSWLHAFAPKGHHDFFGIYPEVGSFAAMETNHWMDLAQSLLGYFRYFQEVGLASFNLAIFIPLKATSYNKVHVRLIPRMTIGGLGTSDMNVLNYLHGDSLSMKIPEKVAKEAAVFLK